MSDELLAWWLGELDPAASARVEEHLFACGDCAARLERLVSLGSAIRDCIRRGEVGFVATGALIGRMKSAGLTVREYAAVAGGSVSCTIAAGDDFVVAHLHAKLEGVSRLDVLVEDPLVGRVRLEDVPFDPAAEGVTMVPSATMLRSLTTEKQRVRLLSVEAGADRVLGDYTFNHYRSEV